MKVILGVTASISAYRAVDVMRTFQKKDHRVTVVMTPSATRFIPSLPFETFAPGRVYSEMFDPVSPPLLHIDLARENELLLVAPATANTIGKFAAGIADNLLTSLFLAFSRTVVIAPSMNTTMLENPATARNMDLLKKRGIGFITPAEGDLACGVAGKGKLPPPHRIYRECMEMFDV